MKRAGEKPVAGGQEGKHAGGDSGRGAGARLGGETELRPKPLVEIGGRPILRHVMDRYAAAGYRDFLIATGYRGK